MQTLQLQRSLSNQNRIMKETVKQSEAISSWNQGAVCVTAGPGSGKTTVLVERFRWLVNEKNVDPKKILAVTFTEKAAQNLIERLGEHDDSLEKQQQMFRQAPIATIHSFCSGLLREYAFEIGLDPEFSVMDEWESKIEQNRIIREALEQAHANDSAALEQFLRSFGGNDIERHLSKIHQEICAADKEAFVQISNPQPQLQNLVAELENAANQGKWPELVAEAKLLRLASETSDFDYIRFLRSLTEKLNSLPKTRAASKILKRLRDKRDNLVLQTDYLFTSIANQDSRAWLAKILIEIELSFQRWKRSSSKCDFFDLERYTVQLLKKHHHLAERFDHILVDEYQDINPVQNKLIELLQKNRNYSARTLFAVGDINQSIYGFRYAAPSVFRDFRNNVEIHGGHPIELRENFRSRPDILLAAETFLHNAEGVESRSLTAKRCFPPKSIPSVEILATYGNNKQNAKRREARHLAARILELKHELELGVDDSGKKSRKPEWKDFAVLARSRTNLEAIAKALQQTGIPYTTAGKGFFNAPEIRDLINVLHILVNPRDEIRCAAVLRSPLVGIKDETLLTLKINGCNLVQALDDITVHSDSGTASPPLAIDPIDSDRLKKFHGWLTHFRLIRDRTPIDLLLSRILIETGYETYLLSQPTGRHQAANVRKFIEILRGQSEKRPVSFDSLILHVEKMRSSQSPEGDAPVLDPSENTVHLMTIHAAKGLEFPVVIIPSVQSPTPNSVTTTGFSPTCGVGAKWKTSTAGSGQDDEALNEINRNATQQRREESNRLFYVAITRAEEHLILSCCFGSPSYRATAWAQLLKKSLESIHNKEDGHLFDSPDNTPHNETLGEFKFRLFRTDLDPVTEHPVNSPEEISPVELVQTVNHRPDYSDSAATVTGVSLFSTCPRRYYLSHYLRFRAKHRPINPIPTTVLNEDYSAEYDKPDSEELGLRVHAILANASEPDPAEKEVAQLVRRFRESDLGRQVPSDAKHEQDLLFNVDGHLLRGHIDLWFDNDDNKRFLIDYKTDRVDETQVAQRAQRYELQLRLYAHAIKQATGRAPDRAELYFLRANKTVEVDIGSKTQQSTTRAVNDFFEAQSNLDFPLSEGDQCYQCPYYQGLCPAKPAQ
ncbi:MAG: hypothetical protein CMN58_04005 [Solibacterales bacterium]|nr:hypothetical protein [Bryobacterales bacterium]